MLVRTWPLHGGVSAQTIAFEAELPYGKRRKFVLRRHGQVDRLQNPHVAADEFHLLEALRSAGMAVPEPVLFDESGNIFPTPYIVLSFVEGETITAPADLEGYMQQMAGFLAELHAVEISRVGLSHLRRADQKVSAALAKPPAELDAELQEGRIRAALSAVWPLENRNGAVLLHGDYWPGNILWRENRIASVIDWEDAAVGDPLADMANARLEILWAHGREVMQRFTQYYLATTHVDATHLPYWDLYTALRPIAGMASWGLDEDVLRRMVVRHKRFTEDALQRIRDIRPAPDH